MINAIPRKLENVYAFGLINTAGLLICLSATMLLELRSRPLKVIPMHKSFLPTIVLFNNKPNFYLSIYQRDTIIIASNGVLVAV